MTKESVKNETSLITGITSDGKFTPAPARVGTARSVKNPASFVSDHEPLEPEHVADFYEELTAVVDIASGCAGYKGRSSLCCGEDPEVL